MIIRGRFGKWMHACIRTYRRGRKRPPYRRDEVLFDAGNRNERLLYVAIRVMCFYRKFTPLLVFFSLQPTNIYIPSSSSVMWLSRDPANSFLFFFHGQFGPLDHSRVIGPCDYFHSFIKRKLTSCEKFSGSTPFFLSHVGIEFITF